MTLKSPSRTQSLIDRLLPVESGERAAVLSAFGWFFLLMCGYQILRPIRETLVSELESGEKQWLFLGTFLVMLAAVPVFGWLVTKVPRRGLVHVVMHFFATNILGFSIWEAFSHAAPDPWLARVFFVWVSVFSLFMTSLFWSVMVDIFSDEQSRRLFGPIASGATVGAIAGSSIAGQFASYLGLPVLMLLSAGMLEAGMLFAAGLDRSTRSWQVQKKQQPEKFAGILEGLRQIVRSRYLVTIAIYLALISFCGTTVYMQLTDVAKTAIEDRAARAEFFAGLNLYVQTGTLLAQTLLIGMIMRRLGLSVALIILPVVYGASFLLLGSVPGNLAVLGLVDVMTRIGAYGFAVPAREVLFTVVSREAKYKSKNFIDTVVFRGADSVASAGYAQLKNLFGAVAPVSWVMLPLTGIWILTGWSLGRQQSKLARKP